MVCWLLGTSIVFYERMSQVASTSINLDVINGLWMICQYSVR